jgi:hypothetical protein
MKTSKLSIIAIAAIMLTGCGFGDTKDESLSAAPAPVASTTTATATMPDAGTGTATAAPTSTKAPEIVQASDAHIDASAFLNALVESGCQVENAEYKEVKRGGAIKVVCSKPVDSLNVEIDDL